MNYTQADVKLAEAYELLADNQRAFYDYHPPETRAHGIERMIAANTAWLRDYEERFDTVSVAVAKEATN